MSPLQRFKNLVEVDKKDIYQILMYAILGGVISLSLPLGIQSIVNFIQAGKVSTSWIVLVIMVVIGVAFVGILKIMQYRITENLQQKIFVRSSFEFAYRFPKIKFNYLYNYSAPELANRFFDTLSVQKGFSKLLLDIFGAVLQILFGVILLSLYHPFFIFFGFIILAILYFIFKLNFTAGLETSLKESKYKYRVAHWIQEIARNHLSFKSKNVFEFSLQKNDKIVSKYLVQRENHFAILRRQFIQLTGFKVLVTAGLLIIGGILVLNQQMNIGQFVAAEIIILTIITAVEKLFSGLELFYDVLTSLEKLGTVVDMEIETEKANPNYQLEDDPIIIETNNVCFKFPDSESPVLQNINLKIEPNDCVLIEGENGSGKTTLLRILSRLIEPSTGNVFINNVNYKKFAVEDYQSKIGIITINDTLFEGTILENITCKNPKITNQKLKEVTDNLDITNYIKRLPSGFDTRVYAEGKQINSSIIQKILLARCIINEPKILFLEEPLSKVDPKKSNQIIDYLTDKKHDWTLVIISQNDYWTTKVNKRFILEKGEIISKK
jgi:ABC-type bacteriocin/lantibiotic exporter with double-glycine peptidase domain